MKYIKQLDTIRAFSVLLVVITHWIPSTHPIHKIPLGYVGVTSFFVLSGFLITNILLNNKDSAEVQGISKASVLKSFYLRRSLRIFPIYYLTLALLYAFQSHMVVDIRTPFVYFLTYTQNYYIFRIKEWPGLLGHLWTLAIEEQFYLLWPFVIMFIKANKIIYAIIAFIAIGLITHVVVHNVVMGVMITSSSFDAFGIGALLSWFIHFKPHLLRLLYKWVTWLAALSVVLFFFVFYPLKFANILPTGFIISIVAAWLMLYIYINHDQDTLRFKFLLNNRYLIFIGKISYGIYLYHNILPAFFDNFIRININSHLPEVLGTKYFGVFNIIENLVLILSLSWLSYSFIEKPFLKLKQRFKYVS
ncbi:acyltransferase family protein [Mucilaginibacter sp.]|jgi:peptidoglycan/LPS O-acetylase OafA/YrhL|uniref:acyltransferase family protein n=1 Tax=Mucilaginibacter sp. TaxID=1882438 RepID=UPI00356AC135